MNDNHLCVRAETEEASLHAIPQQSSCVSATVNKTQNGEYGYRFLRGMRRRRNTAFLLPKFN
jgi:hypothetical protein